MRQTVKLLCVSICVSALLQGTSAFAETPELLPALDAVSASDNPMARFEKAAAMSHIPWFYIAAVYQYESSLLPRKKQTAGDAARVRPDVWCGTLNPDQADRFEGTIRVYRGMGRDGNRDGSADPSNTDDVVYAFASMLASNGTTEDDIRSTLWTHYHDSLIVERISGFARLYNEYKTVVLQGNSFPVDQRYNYTFRSTWGDRRGWGGRRTHQGTDIFAGYGTPVLATTYGMVELKGWNEYGGWRIGIRDLNNVYHYYAHLSRFERGLQIGSLVKPGQRIGYVGSSGYGKPGTSGKFAPHLHYAMYRDTGTREYAFDPAPYLYWWQRQSRQSR